jgi:ergothioneine biosynthesis protein EgtB
MGLGPLRASVIGMTATGNAPRTGTATAPAARGGANRADTLSTFRRVRAHTEALTAPLSAEDQVVQSMPDVSPTKWHRAHTTWFFETFVLGPNLERYQSPDPAYAYLFNSYYEQIGSRHPRAERGLISRPSVDEVSAYRCHVDIATEQIIATASDDAFAKFAAIIEVGCHHEQQHQELLLMDIKHVLSCNPLDPRYDVRPQSVGAVGAHHSTTGAAKLVEFEGGLVDIGHDGNGFSFDNETPRHTVLLAPFRLADRLVTAGEWKAFIEDDGYSRAELWLSDGWATVQSQRWNAPLYWHREDDGEWSLFTLEGRRPVVDSEPVVHVSHYEADAFARWSGARLPTEFEWEHAAAFTAATAAGTATDDSDSDSDALHLHPRAATAGDGLRQLATDVWQWTASAYLPYPRFVPEPGALGEYNGKFMSNQMVLRGGACVTPAGHVRDSYRNFFPPGARWAFSGVRLAADG